MTIYCISGLGSNYKAFERIDIGEEFNLVFIEWKVPAKKESFESYVKRMAQSIDESQPFLLMGLSFGGILVQEIAQIKSPKGIILLSTVKNRKELPFWMRVFGNLKLDYLVPPNFFSNRIFLTYAFFRKIYNKKIPELITYFTQRDAYYLKWSMHQIINYKRLNTKITVPYIHIHGTNDIVFSHRNLKNIELIKKGSHLMILIKSREINKILRTWTLKFL